MMNLIQRIHYSYVCGFSSHRRPDLLHCHLNRVQVQTLPTEQAAPVRTDSFSQGYDPYTHACEVRPLTIVGRTSLSVIIIIVGFEARSAQVAGAGSRCGHMIAHKQLREWLLNGPCVPLLPTDRFRTFSTVGQPVLIGLQATHGSHKLALQAGYLVVRGVRLLGFLGSAKLEQALYRPIHKGSARRPGSLGQGAHTATPTSQWQSPHH